MDYTYAIERALQDDMGKNRLKVVRNRVNKGKGASIRRGIKHARGDLVIVQDGDLEYDPSEIPSLVRPLLAGEADAVYGSRFLRQRGCPPGMAWANYIANRFLTWLTNCLYNTHLTDMETCYKVLRRDQFAQLHLRANRFEFEPEITAKLAKSGIKIFELPISYHGRTYQEGKKIRPKDLFIAIWTLVRNFR